MQYISLDTNVWSWLYDRREKNWFEVDKIFGDIKKAGYKIVTCPLVMSQLAATIKSDSEKARELLKFAFKHSYKMFKEWNNIDIFPTDIENSFISDGKFNEYFVSICRDEPFDKELKNSYREEINEKYKAAYKKLNDIKRVRTEIEKRKLKPEDDFGKGFLPFWNYCNTILKERMDENINSSINQIVGKYSNLLSVGYIFYYYFPELHSDSLHLGAKGKKAFLSLTEKEQIGKLKDSFYDFGIASYSLMNGKLLTNDKEFQEIAKLVEPVDIGHTKPNVEDSKDFLKRLRCKK